MLDTAALLPVVPSSGYFRRGAEITGKFFSKSDDVLKWSQKANHLFGSKNLAKHKLSGFLKLFGGDGVAATKALQSKTQSLFKKGSLKLTEKGIFETTVTIKNVAVTVRGKVIDGVTEIGTAFVK